jgi:hypothetical protein
VSGDANISKHDAAKKRQVITLEVRSRESTPSALTPHLGLGEKAFKPWKRCSSKIKGDLKLVDLL